MKFLHKKITKLAVLGALCASFNAYAGVTTDAHGNVGYDTAEECDAAVMSGQARFYTPFTHKSPLKRKGEARVETAQLRDLGAQYERGACDIGVGRRMGRDGVSTALQGKYIPFSPDMPVNVYTDAAGNALRVTMAKCDNWFSGNAPRPVSTVAVSTPTSLDDSNVSAPEVVVPAAAATAGFFAGVKPYVFGTVGALHAGVDAGATRSASLSGVSIPVTVTSNDEDTRFAGQVGFGTQFNKYLGAELFYTGSPKHKFDMNADLSSVPGGAADTKFSAKTQQHTYGARLTLGDNVTDKLRLFAKGGIAGTTMKVKSVTGGDASNSMTALASDEIRERATGLKGTFSRGTAGLGATYNLNDNLALRADYDHYFKKNYKGQTAKGKNYVGVGVQYNFR